MGIQANEATAHCPVKDDDETMKKCNIVANEALTCERGSFFYFARHLAFKEEFQVARIHPSIFHANIFENQ